MDTVRPALVSEEEFLALPESTERVDFIDGEVIVSPSPSPWHQELLRRIVFALGQWLSGQDRPAFVGQAPLDVRFAPGRILQPDAFVILDRVDLERPGPLEQIPDICIEVLSTNRAYDRLTKRLVYAAAGVAECWLVEPSGLVERWWGQGLGEAEEARRSLASPLLPGFRLDVPALFRR